MITCDGERGSHPLPCSEDGLMRIRLQVGIALSGLEALVAEEVQDLVEGDSLLDEPRGACVPHGMRRVVRGGVAVPRHRRSSRRRRRPATRSAVARCRRHWGVASCIVAGGETPGTEQAPSTRPPHSEKQCFSQPAAPCTMSPATGTAAGSHRTVSRRGSGLRRRRRWSRTVRPPASTCTGGRLRRWHGGRRGCEPQRCPMTGQGCA